MAELAAAPPVSSSRGEERPHLIFRLGGDEYAVDIRYVREIRSYGAVTPIPNAAPFVRGVMNLRGAIIPVVDLRRRFGLADGAYDRFSVVIVVQIAGKVVGVLVDAVCDVRPIAAGDVRPMPHLGAPVDGRLIAGAVPSGDTIVILLDVAHVIADDGAPAGRDAR